MNMKGKTDLIKDAQTFGAQLAYIHNRPLPQCLHGYTRLDGNYLFLKSRMLDMPHHEEIEGAIKKLDAIIARIVDTSVKPTVALWNKHDNPISPSEGVYGNPAWDLGLAINMFGNVKDGEELLRQYLYSQGVHITIIELYSGILYAMLNETIIKQDKAAWEHLAKNECSSIIHNRELRFKAVSNRMLSRLGLPGLNRIE